MCGKRLLAIMCPVVPSLKNLPLKLTEELVEALLRLDVPGIAEGGKIKLQDCKVTEN